MALGKRCRGAVIAEEEGSAFGFVRYTRGLGRKRIVISNEIEESTLDSTIRTPLKRQCSGRINLDGCEKSPLEALPQDILIRILCGVDHEDLKQLFHVSKTIREASLIAKQWHFAYTTPKKTRVFRNSIDFDEDSSYLDEIEAPNAPRQARFYRRISKKDLSDISVALFA